MQTIAAKVKVNADRTVTVQLPADVQMGEYDAVLVLNSHADSEVVPESSHVKSEEQDEQMALRWQKWFEEVEQLPLSTNSIQPDDYHQHLIEKYRKQGLVL
jgi:hypothetical protein